jgi:hypothetical protein
MGRLRLFGELIEAGGAVEGGGGGGGGGGGHQIARVVRTAGDCMTTSTSFVDIDTNNLVINLTTGDSWVLLLLLSACYVSSLKYGCFDFTIDGVRQGQAKGVQYVQAVYDADVQIAWLAPVTAGSHVFRPQWRVTGGSAVLRASSAETPLLFAVLELQ